MRTAGFLTPNSAAAERLHAGLHEFAALARPNAKHRADVGVARLPFRRAAGEMVLRDGDGEVGTQRQFLAAVGAGQVELSAQVLACELHEHARRIDDRQVDEAVAGVGEQRA